MYNKIQVKTAALTDEVEYNKPVTINGKSVIPTRETYIKIGPSLTMNSIPAAFGNLMASNVSVTTDLTKAIIAILAGAGAGYGINNLTKNYANNQYTTAALLGLGGIGSTTLSYLSRRILDRFENNTKK
ncbi:MAG: hypothetical protein QMC67_13230 [Candidatus Wallbacteria bacterium]